MKYSSRHVAALAAVLIVSACSGAASGAVSGSDDVDPAVLQDVVAATFRLPGDEVLRAMRVDRFARELGIVECGGEAGPIDNTSGRVDQSKYPDLELIRERGFSEQDEVEVEDQRLAALDDCPDLAPDLDAYGGWDELRGPWDETVEAVEQDPRLDAVRQQMGACLAQRTGLPIAVGDPVASYLGAVDVAVGAGAEEADRAEAYADCAGPYFDELRQLLLAKRPAMVERHREVITRYASELVGAGYIP